MLIRFKKPDPRDGMVARMDSSIGERFIAGGNADELTEQGEPKEAKAVIAASENKAKPNAKRK